MIKVFLPIREAEIRAFVDTYNARSSYPPVQLDEQRLSASDGMELSFDDIVRCPTEQDELVYAKFIMTTIATAINYLKLIK